MTHESRPLALRSFAFLLLAASVVATSRGADESNSEERPLGAFAKLDRIAETYGVKMDHEAPRFPVQLGDGQIRGKAADREKLAAYVTIFAEEFARYPVEFVKQTGLRRVVFCEALAWEDQLRAALPDFANDTLYLDVVRGIEREGYQRRVFHHEFFHMVDDVDDGLLYRDDRWSAANPEGFRYGAGGHTVQTVAGTGHLSDKYPGFLNHYSTTGVEEDKAEIFAYLFVDPAELTRRASTDAVLRAKVELMKRLLEEFCPEMGEPAPLKSAAQCGEPRASVRAVWRIVDPPLSETGLHHGGSMTHPTKPHARVRQDAALPPAPCAPCAMPTSRSRMGMQAGRNLNSCSQEASPRRPNEP